MFRGTRHMFGGDSDVTIITSGTSTSTSGSGTSTGTTINSVTGPTGPEGTSGVPGPIGPTGTPGLEGSFGVPGPIGPPGVTGTEGTFGVPGPIGPTGMSGMNGLPGIPGPMIGTLTQSTSTSTGNGLPGIPGPVGPTGPEGSGSGSGSSTTMYTDKLKCKYTVAFTVTDVTTPFLEYVFPSSGNNNVTIMINGMMDTTPYVFNFVGSSTAGVVTATPFGLQVNSNENTSPAIDITTSAETMSFKSANDVIVGILDITVFNDVGTWTTFNDTTLHMY